MIHEREQRSVFVAHRLPIDAVHRRRKEEIAHLPPAFEVDLVPLGMSIQLHVESLDLVLVILGLELVFWQIDDGVIFFDLHQHLFAVERDLIIVHVAQDGLLAIVHVVNAKMRFPVSVRESFFVILADVISRCAA